ncbi:hypothetical protein RUM44_004099 [Polyplax serrata]|uniref:Uncharacterized protein n=1 Tax=Polyplax serrata TaxID=468196 RepID=A0ABR1B3L8_POLSC
MVQSDRKERDSSISPFAAVRWPSDRFSGVCSSDGKAKGKDHERLTRGVGVETFHSGNFDTLVNDKTIGWTCWTRWIEPYNLEADIRDENQGKKGSEELK